MDPLERLLEIMARLRDKERGCPWDRLQTFATIAPYTIEEAYEVDDAIRRGDRVALCEELGDLLLQVVYHAQMAREEGSFVFDDVARQVCDKLVRRHPHVFGTATVESADAQTREWEGHKAAERAASAGSRGLAPGVLDDLPLALPALLRAHKLQQRAARAGLLDEPASPPRALARLEQEVRHLEHGTPDPAQAGRLHEALGDLLESCVAFARSMGLDCEQALREANARLERAIRLREAARAVAAPRA
ncbi:MAG TPA: nucleoside triphosphate pyrophosphohydrolase [Myxococcota bacterium]|nr:nucleoside triphosphate pyrophosphohydrolase [Myxococcota bacterium]